jgi:hypothetical protein
VGGAVDATRRVGGAWPDLAVKGRGEGDAGHRRYSLGRGLSSEGRGLRLLPPSLLRALLFSSVLEATPPRGDALTQQSEN